MTNTEILTYNMSVIVINSNFLKKKKLTITINLQL